MRVKRELHITHFWYVSKSPLIYRVLPLPLPLGNLFVKETGKFSSFPKNRFCCGLLWGHLTCSPIPEYPINWKLGVGAGSHQVLFSGKWCYDVVKHKMSGVPFCFSGFFFFLAVLGLHCCVWAFSSCSERGLLLVAVHGLLIAVASLVAEHRL